MHRVLLTYFVRLCSCGLNWWYPLVSLANQRLTSITPPSTITRAQHTLNERKYILGVQIIVILPVMLSLLPINLNSYNHNASLCHAIIHSYLFFNLFTLPKESQQTTEILLLYLSYFVWGKIYDPKHVPTITSNWLIFNVLIMNTPMVCLPKLCIPNVELTSKSCYLQDVCRFFFPKTNVSGLAIKFNYTSFFKTFI